MIRRLILLTLVAFFAVGTLITSPVSANAAGLLDRFQDVQQANQKAQEDQNSKQDKYPKQEQYIQSKQVPQMQQTNQGKDGKYSYSNNKSNQPDSQNDGQSASVRSEPTTSQD